MSVLKRIKIEFDSIKFLMYLLAITLSTLLLGYATSGIVLGVFIFFSIRYAYIHKTKLSFGTPLLLPMLLYILFALSLIWSVDKTETLKGLERTVCLILVPLAFTLLPRISQKEFKIVLKFFTLCNFILGVLCLSIATFNYFKTNSLTSFTYHDLVSVFDLNAIYVSLIFSMSLFYLLALKQKTIKQYALLIFFLLFVFLLSSKTILFVLCIAFMIHMFRLRFHRVNIKKLVLMSIISLAILGISSIKLSERFLFEKHTNFDEVLHKDHFGKVYYWTGSSIRLLQLRILKEQIEEESILLKGFGLFASKNNLKERHKTFDTYFKFHNYNYHNQYAQIISEIGIFGLIILILMLSSILFTGIKTKDFLMIMFAIMMASVFFTESVLWRQRGLFLFIIFYSLFIKLSYDPKIFRYPFSNRGDASF